MSTLISIGLLGVFAYHCLAIYKDFRGASAIVRGLMQLIGIIGTLTFYVLLVISFWRFAWWQSILTLIASIIIGGPTAIIFQKTLIGMILSPVLVLTFLALSIISLI